MKWYFGAFCLDTASASLWHGTQRLPVRPKAFDVLVYLVTHAGELVLKDALLEAVWPEAVVGDAVLKVRIRELRQLLGEGPHGAPYIETAPRRGYRFSAPVAAVTAADTVWVPEATAAAPGLATPVTPPPRAPASIMVGRETELRQLRHRWELACAGHRQMVLVTGEPGLGKTTLVDAFAAELMATTGVWLAGGQCVEHYGVDPHGAREPYRPILDALGQLCRVPTGSQLLPVLRQYAPMWLVQMPWLLDDTEYDTLQRRLVGTRLERMVRELAAAIEVLTRTTPLVLLLEDLHWSDYATLELLTVLARRRESARFLVVGTYRPTAVCGQPHPLQGMGQDLCLHGHAVHLPLSYFSREAVQAYLTARFPGQAVPADVVAWLQRWTGGNPLFLMAVLDQILAVDKGSLLVDAGAWKRPEVAEALAGSVPDTLQQMIEGQLARLPPEVQGVLEVGSVVGEEFTAAAVAAGLATEVEQAEEWCKELVRQRYFVTPRGSETWPDGTVSARYGFRHTLYREVVYHQVPAAQRRRFHQRVSLRLEQGYGKRTPERAVELAIHCELGRDYGRAVYYRQEAAALALQRQAYREGIAHLTRGLALLPSLPDTPERTQHELTLQHTLGAALMATRGFAAPDVERAYSRAHELCHHVGPSPRLFRVLEGLGAFYFGRGEYNTALELGEQCVSLAQHLHEPALLLHAQIELAMALVLMGDFMRARAYLDHGIDFYSAQPQSPGNLRTGLAPEVQCRGYAAMVLLGLGYPDQALTQGHEALRRARELSHDFSLAAALHFATILHQVRRQALAVHKLAEALLTLAGEQGFGLLVAQGTIQRGWALAEQGQYNEGISQIRQGIATHQATGARYLVPYYHIRLAEAYGRAGQAAAGLEALAMAQEELTATGERFWEAEGYRLQGELLLALSENYQAQAEGCWRHALAVARRQHMKTLELRAAVSLCRLWYEQGKRAAAQQLLAAVYGWFTEGFDTADLQEARALLEKLSTTSM